jgi:hypothetical protein
MDTFAETEIVRYHLSFADLGKQINVRFPFPFAANKQKFAVFCFLFQKTNGSFSLPFAELWRHGHGDKMETWRH